MLLDNITWFEEVGSTNSVLADMVRRGRVANGSVVAASHQSGGRGRHSRQWLTKPGVNLTFSVYLRYDIPPAQFAPVTLVAALAVGRYLRGRGIDAQLKWPNDVLVSGRKICGILAETVDSGSDFCSGVVGIGLNVNMAAADAAKIDKPATSMLIETGSQFALQNVLTDVLEELEAQLSRRRRGGFAPIARDWESMCCHLGRPVTIAGDADDKTSKTLHGVFAGLGDGGELMLRLSCGEVKAVMSGDVVIDRE
jgi:BirA family transcriptional regulator, biotin operon repressor / biotin---[acetyl-CoA-carboxylase] ligase